jgi:hypothetical protein
VYCGVTEGCGYVIAQQIVGCVAAVGWAVANSIALIWILGRLQLMRVDLVDEMAGLDSVNHGGSVNMTPIPAGIGSTSAMPIFRFAGQHAADQLQQPPPNQDLLAQLQLLQQQFHPQQAVAALQPANNALAHASSIADVV